MELISSTASRTASVVLDHFLLESDVVDVGESPLHWRDSPVFVSQNTLLGIMLPWWFVGWNSLGAGEWGPSGSLVWVRMILLPKWFIKLFLRFHGLLSFLFLVLIHWILSLVHISFYWRIWLSFVQHGSEFGLIYFLEVLCICIFGVWLVVNLLGLLGLWKIWTLLSVGQWVIMFVFL